MPAEAVRALETTLQQAGLELLGTGIPLSGHGLHWLHDSPLLEDLTPAEADILGAALLLVRAQPGQVLVHEGEVGDWMLLLLRGTVDVTKRADAWPACTDATAGSAWPLPAGSTRLAVIKPGAAVGEMSMLDGEPRYATCTAIEVVEAGVMTRKAIARLIHDHPAVGAKLLVKLTQLLARRLRSTGNQLARMLHKK